MSGVFAYMLNAAVRDGVQEVIGTTLTRPLLAKTDGRSITYAVDVKIATDDPAGIAWTDENDPVLDRVNSERILRSVPIAVGNRDLIYAEAGSPVTLARGPSGKFEVAGFAKRAPGTHTVIAVDLDTLVPATPVSIGISVHVLTYDELADPRFGGGYGAVPYGAFALMRGDTVLEVRS